MVVIIWVAVLILFFFSTDIFAKRFSANLCKDPAYTCYVVKRGETWVKLFPDPTERDVVMRINRMNTKLYSGMKIAIPHENNFDLLAHSPLPQQIDPPGKNLIIISFTNLAFGAYDSQGSLQHWGPISGGKGYCPDIGRRCNTPKGQFVIYEKRGSGCISTKFPVGKGGAPMPYCMFFHGGFALHGSYIVPGYNDSHGCVRLFVNDAKWINQEFTAGTRTTVLIK